MEELHDQLRSIFRSDGQSAEFAKDVDREGLATIELKEPFDPHNPDGQFRHKEARYLGVILEVAYP